MTDQQPAIAKSGWRSLRRPTSAAFLVVPCLLLVLTACGDSPSEPMCEPIPRNVDGTITPPVKVFAPQPQYTEEARRARIQGVVIVQAIIDCKGKVTNVTVLKGLSHGLTEAAVDAISRWRFEPATFNGRPVTVYYNLTVNFRLQDP